MAGDPCPRVDETGVAAMQIGESPAQAVFVRRNEDDVHMIGHEAIDPDLRSGACAALCEKIELERVVAVLKEVPFTPVPHLGYVMRKTGGNETARRAMD